MPDIDEIMENDQRDIAALKKDEAACHAMLQETRSKACALGPETCLKKGPFQKLKNFLAQIAGLQAKEDDLLGRIESIENKHAALKKTHQLHQANKSILLEPPPADEEKPEKRKDKGLWGLLAFLVFFADEDKKKNNADPMPR